MKRSLFVLMALLLATPALGAVTITCTDEDEGVVLIEYNNTEPNRIRAFALDVSIDSDCADINSVYDFDEGTGTWYGIFPGTIDLSDVENPVWGTPVAPSDSPGAEGTGLYTNRVILEMGSLYEPNLAGPPNSGMLCKLYVGGASWCSINISIEPTRGGVVLEDGTSVGITSTGCDHAWIYPPDCWDCLTQCHGDVDCDGVVDIDDFYPFKDAFGSIYPHANYDPCADFDRNGDVDIDDFYTFKDSFIVTGVPGDCPQGDINEIFKP